MIYELQRLHSPFVLGHRLEYSDCWNRAELFKTPFILSSILMFCCEWEQNAHYLHKIRAAKTNCWAIQSKMTQCEESNPRHTRPNVTASALWLPSVWVSKLTDFYAKSIRWVRLICLIVKLIPLNSWQFVRWLRVWLLLGNNQSTNRTKENKCGL